MDTEGLLAVDVAAGATVCALEDLGWSPAAATKPTVAPSKFRRVILIELVMITSSDVSTIVVVGINAKLNIKILNTWH